VTIYHDRGNKVAEIIFKKCCELGIEERLFIERWDNLSAESQGMYIEIAEAVMDWIHDCRES